MARRHLNKKLLSIDTSRDNIPSSSNGDGRINMNERKNSQNNDSSTSVKSMKELNELNELNNITIEPTLSQDSFKLNEHNKGQFYQ